jgi:STE24 endopeptidase
MGHEMGHYRLQHGLWLSLGFTLTFAVAFWVIHRLFGRFLRRHGERWRIGSLADPGGLPLAFAIFTVVLYLLTPVTNAFVRTAENQADAFGLDAAREPHGFASVAMRLASHRKVEPGALEELIFFDHPSGRARVRRAMQWLADHPPAP